MAVSWRGTLEGFFVGFTISLILSGMLIAQVGTFYRYHEAKPNAVTALILVIFALENGQTVFMSIGAWDYMISWHGDLSQFRSPVFAIGAIVFIATACNTLCRCIFAYSIYKLNGHRGLFPVIIIVLTLIVLGRSVESHWRKLSRSFSGFDHVCDRNCTTEALERKRASDVFLRGSCVVPRGRHPHHGVHGRGLCVPGLWVRQNEQADDSSSVLLSEHRGGCVDMRDGRPHIIRDIPVVVRLDLVLPRARKGVHELPPGLPERARGHLRARRRGPPEHDDRAAVHVRHDHRPLRHPGFPVLSRGGGRRSQRPCSCPRGGRR